MDTVDKTPIDVPQVGNCLFEAVKVSYTPVANTHNHISLRAAVTAHMLVNKNLPCGATGFTYLTCFENTYKLDNGDATFHNKFAADDMTYERYIDTMALENEFGDNLCCQSICDLFNIKLHVYHTTTMQWWHMSPTLHVDRRSLRCSTSRGGHCQSTRQPFLRKLPTHPQENTPSEGADRCVSGGVFYFSHFPY